MDIKEILNSHAKWLRGESGGRRADLRDSDLCGAILRDADLRDADLSRANLCDSILRDANLSRANLCDSILCDSDLRRANLRNSILCDSDLRRANLWGCAGNSRQIKSLFISEKYQITYTAEYLQIGCQRHEISEWWGFDDETISRMDDGALDWWRSNKDFIRMVIDKYPASH